MSNGSGSDEDAVLNASFDLFDDDEESIFQDQNPQVSQYARLNPDDKIAKRDSFTTDSESQPQKPSHGPLRRLTSEDSSDLNEHGCKRHKVGDSSWGFETSEHEGTESPCPLVSCFEKQEDSKSFKDTKQCPGLNSLEAYCDDTGLSISTSNCENDGSLEKQIKSIPMAGGMSGFMCPFCHIQESTLQLLEAHISTTHPDGPDQAAEEEFEVASLLWVCPLCDVDLETQKGLATHVTTVHEEEELRCEGHLTCPLCGLHCDSDKEMQDHVRTHESEPTFYGVSVDVLSCPMCSLVLADQDLLTSHVESHFSPQHCPGMDLRASEERLDAFAVNKENIHILGTSSTSEILENQKASQNKGSEKSQTTAPKSDPSQHASTSVPLSNTRQTGEMSQPATGTSSYLQQLQQSTGKTVVSGQKNYGQQSSLGAMNLYGVDDGHSRTDDLIEQLTRLYRQQARPGQHAYLCCPTSHFSGSYGDRGWGCGYRNFQMLMSCLALEPKYATRLSNDGRPGIPSILTIQHMIESAWKRGFDQDGCHQLGARLVNTQKWIGATEIVATLSSLGIRCQLIDFHAPSAPDGSHPRLLEWVRNYFRQRTLHFTPPLYLQHQGHSRTVVGVEDDRGTVRLLVFDPSSKREHLAGLVSAGLNWKAMRTFRRTVMAFKAKQYQVVAVDGLLDGRSWEESKIIKSERVS